MELAEGVSEALITTAAGLMIGIPALVFYSLFRGRVQKYIAELEAAATHLMALLHSQVERQQSSAPTPRAARRARTTPCQSPHPSAATAPTSTASDPSHVHEILQPPAGAAGMQLAPMIDIVFLLLIFFIVTWQFTRSETELDVSVPTAEEGAELSRPKGEIIINVLPDGAIRVEGSPSTSPSSSRNSRPSPNNTKTNRSASAATAASPTSGSSK
jgi:hypothetical protein